MIPKIVYQTWKTKNLHPVIGNIINNMKAMNKDYIFELFDDNDMDTWVKNNCESYIYDAYNKLYVGAAKADLWRYLILYKNGGIYLDIDSLILVFNSAVASCVGFAIKLNSSNVVAVYIFPAF